MLLAGLHEIRHGFDAAIKAMEDAAQAQHAKLQRKVDYLNLLGCLGPMIGLMGTVWGMIVAFTKSGRDATRPIRAQLAGGIAHGLYATVIGLAIAVVGLTCYGVLRDWVDGIAADCSALAERTVAPLRHAQPLRRSEAKSGRGIKSSHGRAAWRSSPPRSSDPLGLNLTPLIDVVFQLLIFRLRQHVELRADRRPGGHGSSRTDSVRPPVHGGRARA